jgi:hypothetical protein
VVLTDCRMPFHRSVMQIAVNCRPETIAGEGSMRSADGDTTSSFDPRAWCLAPPWMEQVDKQPILLRFTAEDAVALAAD